MKAGLTVTMAPHHHADPAEVKAALKAARRKTED
jgi:hypothetical protein